MDRTTLLYCFASSAIYSRRHSDPFRCHTVDGLSPTSSFGAIPSHTAGNGSANPLGGTNSKTTRYTCGRQSGSYHEIVKVRSSHPFVIVPWYYMYSYTQLTLYRKNNSGLNQRTIQEELRPYCFQDPSVPYTRNLIATDHVSYTLLALCWSADQCSPIHDHPGDGCYMRVIDGAIFEKRFRIQSSQLVCTAHQVYTSNQLAFIHDVMGLHQIGRHNPPLLAPAKGQAFGTSQPAVSLHLYTPPIQRCHVFSSVGETGVQVCDSGPMTHYSEYGRRKSLT